MYGTGTYMGYLVMMTIVSDSEHVLTNNANRGLNDEHNSYVVKLIPRSNRTNIIINIIMVKLSYPVAIITATYIIIQL